MKLHCFLVAPLRGSLTRAASGRGATSLPSSPLLLCSDFIRNDPFKWKYKVLVLTSDFLLTLLKNVLLTNHIQGIKIFWLGVFLDLWLNNHRSHSLIRVEKEEQEVWALLFAYSPGWYLFIWEFYKSARKNKFFQQRALQLVYAFIQKPLLLVHINTSPWTWREIWQKTRIPFFLNPSLSLHG